MASESVSIEPEYKNLQRQVAMNHYDIVKHDVLLYNLTGWTEYSFSLPFYQPYRNGNWAHVSCALWIPEVSFGDPETLDNIVNIEKIPKSRWSLSCSLCHTRGGACIQCYVKTCRTAYHVTCAFEFNLHMEMEDNDDPEQDIKFETFCLTHTSLHAAGQNPHASSESSRKRKRVQENLESNENKIDTSVPQTEATLEEENPASTSHDTGIPVVSAAKETIEESGNNVQNGENGSRIGAGLVTEQNLAAISKGTARKSFSLPPKKIQTLSKILPKPNGKKACNEKGQAPAKPKRPSVKNRLASPKKPKAKPSTIKTKAVIHPTPPNISQSEQPSLTEPQFSEKPCNQAFLSSSHSINLQHFQTPNKQVSNAVQGAQQQLLTGSEGPQKLVNSNCVNDFLPSTSNNHLFLASAMSPNGQQSLSDISAISVPQNDNLGDFSRYLLSLLRNLPFKKSLRVQKKIISLVLKECDVSSDEEEFDASSLSSVE